jgi:hypothetical protein
MMTPAALVRDTDFFAIPVNAVLRSCESWAFKTKHLGKLGILLHRLIQRIFSIAIHRVDHDRMWNEAPFETSLM